MTLNEPNLNKPYHVYSQNVSHSKCWPSNRAIDVSSTLSKQQINKRHFKRFFSSSTELIRNNFQLSLYCSMVELSTNLNYYLVIFSQAPNFIKSKLLIQKWSIIFTNLAMSLLWYFFSSGTLWLIREGPKHAMQVICVPLDSLPWCKLSSLILHCLSDICCTHTSLAYLPFLEHSVSFHVSMLCICYSFCLSLLFLCFNF